ncbi:putative ribonuclease H-like domain-containing protein [Tanacetum coccineum]
MERNVKPQEVSLKGYINKKSRLYILTALIVLILLVQHLFSAAGPSFTNDDPSSPVNAAEASNGAEADLNNLETTMNVSPIPTTRIDKDRPKDQIIGDLTRFLMNMLCWVEAMQEELLQFKLQKVWALVDLPNGERAIGTKWVFRNKKDKRGIVVKNKARLVAQGYTQKEGIDYDEVFAHVVRIEAIMLFFAYASFMGFIVYKMDVKSAFLYGTIEEEVYVCQPPGFEDLQFPDNVYKVEKTLYGLHQAPRAWYETLSTYLLENGFRRGTINKTLFIKKDKGDILLVQVYVDDIIFGSTKTSLCDEFEAEILKKFDFATIKTASTPIETNKALVKDEEAEVVDVHLYRSMIGSLMYLIASRPDIMFVVCAYASDYAGASLDRKSTTEGCQFLGRRLISWQCKKHTIVTNSTTRQSMLLLLIAVDRPTNLGKSKGSLRYLSLSGPIHLVANKTVYKEWEDRMERAATTASSLEAETGKDGLGDMSHHKKIYVNPSHTKKIFANVKREGKDFSGRVTPLFATMMVQANQEEGVDSVKKLEKKAGLRTHKFKRLYKVGVTRRVHFSYDDSLGAQEEASNQGRSIEDINKDAEVSLVDETQRRTDDANMFDTDALFGNEVFAENYMIEKDQYVIPKEFSTAAPSTIVVQPPSPIITEVEITLAQTLAKLKSAKSKVVIQEPVQSTATTAPSTIPKAKGITFRDADDRTTRTLTSVSSLSIKDKGKAKMDEPEVPLKKKDQIALDEEMARNLEAQLQAELIEEERLARKKEEEANIALIES